MTDEMHRALFARILAVESIVETLTFAYLLDRPPEVAHSLLSMMSNTGKQIGPPGQLSDVAAEFMADSYVQAGQQLDRMVSRIEEMLVSQGKSGRLQPRSTDLPSGV